MKRDIIEWNGRMINLTAILSIEPPVLYTSCYGSMAEACVTTVIQMTGGSIVDTDYFDLSELPHKPYDFFEDNPKDKHECKWKMIDGSWKPIDSYINTHDENIQCIHDAIIRLNPLLLAWTNGESIRKLNDNIHSTTDEYIKIIKGTEFYITTVNESEPSTIIDICIDTFDDSNELVIYRRENGEYVTKKLTEFIHANKIGLYTTKPKAIN